MIKNLPFIGIIPARKGSVRIKNKNLMILNNKKLIEYTLEQAIKTKGLDKILVTTDDERILKFSKKYKKVIFLKRNKKLSSSKSLLKNAIKNAIKYISNNLNIKNFNAIILQPTSPQRVSKDIDKAIKLFIKNKSKPLVSVSEPINNPCDMLIKKKGKIEHVIKGFRDSNKQKYNNIFFINGSIYIYNSAFFLKNNSVLDDKITLFKMDKKHSIELDDKFDIKLIKSLNL